MIVLVLLAEENVKCRLPELHFGQSTISLSAHNQYTLFSPQNQRTFPPPEFILFFHLPFIQKRWTGIDKKNQLLPTILSAKVGSRFTKSGISWRRGRYLFQGGVGRIPDLSCAEPGVVTANPQPVPLLSIFLFSYVRSILLSEWNPRSSFLRNGRFPCFCRGAARRCRRYGH